MRKKVLALILSLGMVFSVSAPAFAANGEIAERDNYVEIGNGERQNNFAQFNGTVNTGDILSPVESIEKQLAGLSEAQKEIALEKLNDDGSGDAEIMPYATTWNYLTDFVIYKQSTTYYCTVASCKAAMQYLTGSSDSQSTIASALGTTSSGTEFGKAKTYLNNNQSANTYVSKAADTSLTTMKSNFYTAINSFDAPPLISVKLSTSEGWAYNTSGHTMCISGARSDKEYFRIADPYIQWADSDASMFYSKSASAIHDAISDRGNGYIY